MWFINVINVQSEAVMLLVTHPGNSCPMPNVVHWLNLEAGRRQAEQHPNSRCTCWLLLIDCLISLLGVVAVFGANVFEGVYHRGGQSLALHAPSMQQQQQHPACFQLHCVLGCTW